MQGSPGCRRESRDRNTRNTHRGAEQRRAIPADAAVLRGKSAHGLGDTHTHADRGNEHTRGSGQSTDTDPGSAHRGIWGTHIQGFGERTPRDLGSAHTPARRRAARTTWQVGPAARGAPRARPGLAGASSRRGQGERRKFSPSHRGPAESYRRPRAASAPGPPAPASPPPLTAPRPFPAGPGTRQRPTCGTASEKPPARAPRR